MGGIEGGIYLRCSGMPWEERAASAQPCPGPAFPVFCWSIFGPGFLSLQKRHRESPLAGYNSLFLQLELSWFGLGPAGTRAVLWRWFAGGWRWDHAPEIVFPLLLQTKPILIQLSTLLLLVRQEQVPFPLSLSTLLLVLFG